MGIRLPPEMEITICVFRAVRVAQDEDKQRTIATLDLARTLYKVADFMENLQPDFKDAAVHSGIQTRQDSKKASYLRAFAANLEKDLIPLSPAVKRAMAITANVVFNDPNLDITEDDVRKALNRKVQPKR